MNYENLCIFCMREKNSQDEVCPYCGNSNETYKKSEYALPPFTILNGRYLVGKTIGAGGFGITYLAMDLVLERRVAIKEFFMNDAMYRTKAYAVTVSTINKAQEEMYRASREKFEREAKILAHLNNMPGIVQVYDFFSENGTAYIAMEYLDGKTLGEYVREKGGCLSLEETKQILYPIMKSLDKIHKEGILHRDVSPDNIKFSEDGSPKLFDFGGAKLETNDDLSKIAYMKPGYTPLEQYSVNGDQGPWTDVYAMGASIYYCICGKKPPEAPERSCGKAPLSFEAVGMRISKAEENALRKAMTLRGDLRYQTMEEFWENLEKASQNGTENLAGDFEKKERRKQEKESNQKSYGKNEEEKPEENQRNSEDVLRKKSLIWVGILGIGILLFFIFSENKTAKEARTTKNTVSDTVTAGNVTSESGLPVAGVEAADSSMAATEKAASKYSAFAAKKRSDSLGYVVTKSEDDEENTYMYEEPDKSSDIVMKLHKSNVLGVSEIKYEKNGKWAHATYFGCSGWIQLDFLKRVGNMKNETDERGTYYISAEKTYLRSKRSEDGGKVELFRYGAMVGVYSIKDGWGKVSYVSQDGYATHYDGRAVYIHASCLGKEIAGTYVVNTTGNSGLNMRENPSASGAKKGKSIPSGTKLQISQFQNGWGRITYNGEEGWVMMKYLYLDSKEE